MSTEYLQNQADQWMLTDTGRFLFVTVTDIALFLVQRRIKS